MIGCFSYVYKNSQSIDYLLLLCYYVNIRSVIIIANKEPTKMGRPRLIKDENELLDLFLEHYNSEKMKDKLITIENFMMFLKYDKKIINNMLYWYDLGDDFSKAKKEIEMIMKARYDELSQNKDNATSYLIFYGKNKFGMTDKVQQDISHSTPIITIKEWYGNRL